MHHGLDARERLILGMIALTLVTALLYVGVRSALGAFAAGYEIQAVFGRVGQGLDQFSDVRIRGVKVGAVTGLDLDERGRAVVTMRIDPGIEVPDTATASIEPLSIFGPKFVELNPGDHEGVGPFLRAGAVITETNAPTELEDMLRRASDVLLAMDPREVFTIVHTLAEAVDGQGESIGRTLDASGQLAAVLTRHLDTSQQFVADLALIAGTLASRGDEIIETARTLAELLGDLDSRRDEFGELLDATSRLARDTVAVLEENREAITDVLESAVSIAVPGLSVAAGNLDLIPSFIDTLSVFFGTLADVVHVDGVGDQVLGALRGILPPDLCELFQLGDCLGTQ